MTNYSKWDKFAADLASDTEGEEEQQLVDYTKKSARYIHIPARDFPNEKEALCKLLEEDDEFEPPSSGAAGIPTDDSETPAGLQRALTKYGWKSIGSQFIPGYGVNSNGDDLWRVFFDDCFLTTQTVANPGARALLGNASLGSFVVACFDRKSGSDKLISKKEVADLIMRRQQGADGERIDLEQKEQAKRMQMFEELGAQTVDLKPNSS